MLAPPHESLLARRPARAARLHPSLARSDRGASPRASILAKPEYKTSGIDWSLRRAFVEGLPDATVGEVPVPGGPDFTIYTNTGFLARTLEGVWVGQKSKDDALEEIRAQWQEGAPVAAVVFRVVLYRTRHWTWPLFTVNLVGSLAFGIPALWLLLTGRLMNPAYLATLPDGVAPLFGPNGAVTIVAVIIVIIGAVAGATDAAVRTARASRSR